MRRLFLMAVGAWMVGGAVAATDPAQVRLYCLSIRVEPGTSDLLGVKRTLDFSSSNGDPNHEFFPLLQDDLTHASFFRLDGPDFSEPLFGEMAIVAPENLDSNTNGVPDFYEVDAEVTGPASMGFWTSSVTEGDVRVVWQRAAGQHRGTVTLQLTSDEFGTLPEFIHPFEIIEYAGTFEYERQQEKAEGPASLQRVGVPDAALNGTLLVTRQPTNRLHQFTVGESNLTNELGLVARVSIGDVERDTDYDTDYFGAVAFYDGDLTTETIIDYELFFIGVDDPNDADGDGVPDLTDDIGEPPTPPSLGVARDGAGFLLKLQGDIGITYVLERASSLDPDLWVEDRQVTLAQTNEVLSVSMPAVNSRFWRLRWPAVPPP